MISNLKFTKYLAFLATLLVLPVVIFAATETYDFTIPGDYTLSNTELIEVSGNQASLQTIDEFQVNDEIESVQSPAGTLILPDGNVLFVFSSSDGNYVANPDATNSPDNSGSHVAAKVLDNDGQTVVAETQINDFISSAQVPYPPTLLPNGNILFTWSTFDQTNGDTQISSIAGKILNYDGDSIDTVVNEFIINQQTTSFQNDSSAIVLDNNDVLVTWYSNATLGGYIAGRVIDQAGVPQGNEFLINDLTSGVQRHPRHIKLANGNIMIVWQSADTTGSDTSQTHIAGKVVDGTDPTTDIVAEFQINDTEDLGQNAPELIELSNDNILVAWESADTSNGVDTDTRIVGKVINNVGTQVVAEFQINQETEGLQVLDSLALLPNNNVLVTFASRATVYDPGNLNFGQVGRVLNATATGFITNEIQLNEENEDDQNGGEIAVLDNDNVMVFWLSSDTNTPFLDNSVFYVAGKVFNQSLGEVLSSTSPTVQPTAQYDSPALPLGFTSTLSGATTGTVSFQLSEDDGVNWKYHDGAAWVTTTNGVTDSNTTAEVNANITTFNVNGIVLWRAFLNSTAGAQIVELQQVEIIDNGAPVIISEAGQDTVSKTVASGTTLISVVEFTDPDLDSVSANPLEGPDAAQFTLITNLGGDLELSILPNPAADANGDGTYEVTVVVEDLPGAQDTQDFNISFSSGGSSSGGSNGSASSGADTSSPFSPSPTTPVQIIDEEVCNSETALKDIEQFQGFEREVSRFEALEYILLINCIGLDELPENPADYPFSDINLEDERIARVLYTGFNRSIVKGYPDGTFKPTNTVNYVELLAMNARAKNLAEDTDESGEQWFSSYINLGLTIQLALNNVGFGDPIEGDIFYLITKTFIDS